MNNKISCFCLLLLWAGTGYQGLFAQAAAQFPTDRFERVLAGKIKGPVLSFLQTKNGFIWFGTERGLYHYNGYGVKKYISSPKDTNSLSSNTINGLAESKDGKIWISTWGGGLNLFDPASETFQCFRHDPRNKHSLKTDLLRGVAEDPQGRVYAMNDYGFDLFDPARKKFKHFTAEQPYPNSTAFPIRSIFFDRKGRVWIGTYMGLNLFDPKTGVFTTYPRRIKAYFGFVNGVQNIREDSQGRLWVVSDYTIDLFDPNTGQFKNYYDISPKVEPSASQPRKTIGDMQIDSKDRIWFGSTYGKVFCLNPDKKQSNGDKSSALKDYDVGTNLVQLCLLDKQSNAWVLNNYSDIYRFSTNNPIFPLYTPFTEEEKKSRGLSYIMGLQPYEGGRKIMIYSSSQSLNSSHFFNTQTQTFTNISSRPNQFSLVDSIYALEYTAKDGVAVTTYYPTSLRNFKTYLQKQIRQGKKTDQYRLMASYSMGEVVLMEADQDTFQILRHDPNDPNSLSQGVVFNIYRDSKGITWVCTSGGLNRFDYARKKFQHFISDRKNRKSISHSATGSIIEDRKGNYWVGTYHGLEHFNPETGHFELVYGKADETGFVHGIIEDRRGDLWLYCAAGLARYNPITKQGRVYDENDGLVGIKEVASTSFRQLPTGEIVAGGNKGYFTLFHPDSVRQNSFIPPVYITNLSYYQGSKQIFVPGISAQKSLTVSYRENPIMVEFAALNYIDPEKNRYAYKLEGIHQDWIPLGSRRELIFTDLRPGHYTLRIKGSNNDGVWNEVGTTLYLTITPPWWQSTWFYVLLSTLVLGLAYTFYRYRLGQIRQKAEYKQRLAEIETQALRAQMNPHFIFNAIHSMKRFLLSNDVDSAEAYMSKFARLMRLILENSQATLVSLQSELELLDNYIQIEQLRFGHKFDYQIQVAEGLDVEEIMLPSLIIQPYVENAIIHGLSHKRTGKGLLSVKVAGREDALEITIEDNGIGRKQSKEIEAKRRDATPRKSAGMNITQKRLAIFEQNTGTKTAIEITDLHDEAGEAAGTRVDILIAYH